MAVSDAIVFTTACTQAPLENTVAYPPVTMICALRTSRPTGPMIQLTHFSTRLIDDRNSLDTSEKRFASPAK